MMIANRSFDSLFKHSPRIKKFVLENVQNKSFHKELRSIGYTVQHKDVSRKDLKIAGIYMFKKILKKSTLSRRKGSKKINKRAGISNAKRGRR